MIRENGGRSEAEAAKSGWLNENNDLWMSYVFRFKVNGSGSCSVRSVGSVGSGGQAEKNRTSEACSSIFGSVFPVSEISP